MKKIFLIWFTLWAFNAFSQSSDSVAYCKLIIFENDGTYYSLEQSNAGGPVSYTEKRVKCKDEMEPLGKLGVLGWHLVHAYHQSSTVSSDEMVYLLEKTYRKKS